MKMDEMIVDIQELEKRKMERTRTDLISKKLGELLLVGYRMLNETCENCDCILMQKKNEPKYCVGCEDKDVLAIANKINPKATTTIKVEEKSAMSTEPVIKNMRLDTDLKPVFRSNFTANAIPSGSSNSTVEVLRSKISWATEELKTSSNLRYNIELCEMIKTASEAIISLKKIDMD